MHSIINEEENLNHTKRFAEKPSKLFEGKEYSRFRPTYPTSLYDEIWDYVKVNFCKDEKLIDESEFIVDVGSGSGQATCQLANYEHFKNCRIIGIDDNDSMLKNAKKADNIEYRKGKAECVPLNSSSCFLICVAQALHWFNLETFWKEAERLLVRNGTLAIWSYSLPRLDNKKAHALVKNFHEKVLGSYWDERRKMVDNQYFDVSLSDSFENVERRYVDSTYRITLHEFSMYLGTWSAFLTFRKENPNSPDPRKNLLEKIMKEYNSPNISPKELMVEVTSEIVLILGKKG